MNNSELRETDIKSYLSLAKFEKIVKFVLKNGDRQTYCNMYNNNPHYQFEGFQLFLNPITQQINLVEETLSDNPKDYNSITIHDRSPKAKFQYYHIRLHENKIIFYDYYCQNEDDFKLMRKDLLEIYYPIITKTINSSQH